jgi:hypothetical protein
MPTLIGVAFLKMSSKQWREIMLGNILFLRSHDFTLNMSKLMATSDEGPKSRDQWIQAILLVKSFKLVPRPLSNFIGQKL